MLSNSLIKYFKDLNERSNQISTLLFINTISSLGITLSFTANNIIVDSIFFTLLIVHSMCLTITYFYSKSHSAEVKKGSDIINNVMNNEVIKNAINDYDFIYNNNRATKEIGDEDNKETEESDKEVSDKSESDKSESDKSEDGIKEYNSEEYDNNDINQKNKPKDEIKLEFAKKKLLGFKAGNIRTIYEIKNIQEKVDKIISIIDNFDNDIDMKDDKVYYDIKQLIVLFNEIQLLYPYRNAFKAEIDELFGILELIV